MLAAAILENVSVGGSINVNVHQLPPPGQPLFIGLPARPDRVVGRNALLTRLVALLETGQNVALSAAGGFGKTTLAAALAHDPRVRAHFSDGILWGSLSQPADVALIQARWADALGADLSESSDPMERTQKLRDKVGDRSLLFIIDNVWTLDSAQSLLCGIGSCAHLLTTRDIKVADRIAAGGGVVQVRELEEEDALELIALRAPAACRADPDAARALIRAVGGLPLAVELLGAYLAQPERRYFIDARAEALRTLTDPVARLHLARERLDGTPDEGQSLERVLSLTLDVRSPEEVRAFYALGAFAPKPDTFNAAAAQAVADASWSVLARLISLNLVEEVADERFSIHQVLADLARLHLPDDAIERHRLHYQTQFEKVDEDALALDREYGQFRQAWSALPEHEDEARANLVLAVYEYQRRRGLWREQLAWTESALNAVREREWTWLTGILTNAAGLVHHALGERQEALERFNTARRLVEESGDRQNLARVLGNLALVYGALGRPEEALAELKAARPVLEELDDRIGLALNINNAGHLLQGVGEHDEALRYFAEAGEIFDQQSYRHGQATSLNNAGQVYVQLGDLDAALARCQKAREMFRLIGDVHGEALTATNLGQILQGLGRDEEALAFLGDALEIQERIDDDVSRAMTLNNMGTIHHGAGRLDEALVCFREALAFAERTLDSRALAFTQMNMGEVLEAQGEKNAAREHYGKGLSVLKELGNRRDVAGALVRLGEIHEDSGELDQAAEHFRAALAMFQTVEDRAGEGRALRGLARAQRDLGDVQAATASFLEARAALKAAGDDAGVAAVEMNLGNMFVEASEHQTAISYFDTAAQIRGTLGDQRGQSVALRNLGLAHEAVGHIAEALKAMQRAADIADKEHLTIRAEVLNFCGNLFLRKGQPQEALEYGQRARTAARTVGDGQEESIALVLLGRIALQRGQRDESQRLFRDAKEIAAAHPDGAAAAAAIRELELMAGFNPEPLDGDITPSDESDAKLIRIFSLLALASAALHEGRTPEAVEPALEAVSICDHATDADIVISARHILGAAYVATEQPKRALEHLQSSLALARSTGDIPSQGANLSLIGSVQRSLGDHETALVTLSQAAALLTPGEAPSWEFIVHNEAALAYRHLGRKAEALRELEYALAPAQSLGNSEWEMNVLGGLGELHHALGEPRRALDRFREALAIAEATSDQKSESWLHRWMGVASASLGWRDGAFQHLWHALRLAEALKDGGEEAAARVRLAEVFSSAGMLLDAERHLVRALELDERFQAPEVEETRTALADVREQMRRSPPSGALEE